MQVSFLPHSQGAFPNWVERRRSFWDSYKLIFLEGLPLPATGNLIWGARFLLVQHALFSHLWETSISSLRSSWWPHRCREPAVPSSWLPNNVLSARPLEPLGFLKLSDIPWNHKHYRSCHCPTNVSQCFCNVSAVFLHPSESGCFLHSGTGFNRTFRGLRYSSTSTWFFWVTLLTFLYFIPSYVQLDSIPNTF